MIDQAFLPLHQALLEYAAIGKELQTADGGIRSYIYRFHVESPVELDVKWGEDGRLELGTVPPLYDVATSIQPSIHRMRFTAEWTEWKGGDGDEEMTLKTWPDGDK